MLLDAIESTSGLLVERRRPRRTLKWVGIGVLAAVLLIVLGAAGLAWQASRDSLSLNFLDGRIEAAVRSRLPANATVTVGSTGLAFRAGRGLVITAQDIGIQFPGAAELSARELLVVATPAAILRRRIDLSSIDLSDVDIALNVPTIEAGSGSGADAIRKAAGEIFSRLMAAERLIRGSGMDRIGLQNASLRFTDVAGEVRPPLRISEGNWSPLGEGRSKTWLQVEEQGGGAWDVTIEQTRSADGASALTIEVEDLPVSAFAPNLARTESGPFFDAPIVVQAKITGTPEGAVTGIRANVAAGRGEVSFTGNDRIVLAGALVQFALNAEGNRLLVPNGELRTGTGNVLFEGVADLADISRPSLVGRVKRGELPGKEGAPAVRLTGGGVVLSADVVNLAADVERFYLVTEAGTLSAVGQASLKGENPGLSFALSLGEMPAEVARAFWPPFIASKTRSWFDNNVKSGMLGPASLQVALSPESIGPNVHRPLPSNALFGSLPFRNAEFSPLSTLPLVREAQGAIDFAEGLAILRANSGVIQMEGRGELQAAGTTLILPEIGGERPRGDLHLELAGPAAAVAALADNPPFSIAAKRGILADKLSGDAQLSLDANLPLYADHGEVIRPSFRLAVTDFASAEPIQGRLIGSADMVLEGTPESFTVKGKGTLDGVEADLDLVLGSEALGQTAVTLSLDDAARERMGLTLGGMVTGTVQASVNEAEDKSRKVSLDLTAARINLAFLGWEKGAGVPARAEFTMAESGAETRISDFHLSGKGFVARGSLSLEGGKLKELDLTEVALRPRDQVSVQASRGRSGYDVQVRGRSLDGRGIIRGIGGSATKGKLDIEPIRLSVDVDAITGQNDVVLENVSGSALITESGLQSASVKGRTGKSAQFEWDLGEQGGTRLLRVSAADGGALIRFAGIYSRIGGGNLSLEYSGPIGGRGSGVALLRDFRLRDEAALAPAVEAASQRAREAGRRPTSDRAGDIEFSQLRVPFRQEDWVISIDDAALRGALLGGTGSGTINVPGKKLAISGTFIPAFGLNNIAGSIPILGGILGGGRDEGLVGITYKLFGPLDDPDLTMNPLSAMAPGIFRKIFEYR